MAFSTLDRESDENGLDIPGIRWGGGVAHF
jgi:hypothetical protein